MTAPHLPMPSSPASDTDVFSISDAHLAQRYQFIREIGAGNWGCVWLCSPKTDEPRAQAPVNDPVRRVAVKLVFREKKPTTAQRVRSLWNEMKIVRALKQDPHPSIIPFHSFIITPSFAIITMEYLPYLIPVEVPENKARGWFRSLLSAVHFLHCRGVVHNDIKPANILLSTKKVPMFVDFGFAEKYELGTKRAFLSNLAYGTPEYLSPERARGNTHDTRKSDMWSLGITFFEILVGRTPFEYVEGEKFTTPADLERYWARTVKGKWVGSWKMSKSVERMLHRMISSSADVRCTASDAMTDPYWMEEIDADGMSVDESLMMMSSPAPGKTPVRVRKAEAKPMSSVDKENVRPLATKRSALTDDKTRSATRPVRRAYPYGLPPIEGSPLSVRTAAGREYAPPSPYHASRVAVPKARHSVKRKPVPAFDEENMSPWQNKDKGVSARTPERDSRVRTRRSGVLVDATSRTHNIGTPKKVATNAREKGEKAKPAETTKRFGSGSYDRVKAFERLKQLERNRFLEEEEEESLEQLPQEKTSQELERERSQGHDRDREAVVPPKPSSQCMSSTSLGALSVVTKVDERSTPARSFGRPKTATSSFTLMTDFKSTLVDRRLLEEDAPVEESKPSLLDSLPRSGQESSPGLFKHGFKASIDKTLGLYKSSIGRMNTRKASKRASEELDSSISRRESWENDSLIRDAKTSLPVVRRALHTEQVTADNKADRLSLWMRNVEQVVKEAKENFASSSVTPLPPLPARPVSRPHVARASRPSRAPRKILAVDQIFQEPEPISLASPVSPSGCATPPRTSIDMSAALPLPSKADLSVPKSPNRGRRATISTSPSLVANPAPMDSIDGTPSKRKEKSRSAGNLASMIRPISPFSQLQRELEKEDESRPNLSDLLDRSVFIARTSGSTPPLDVIPTSVASPRLPAQTRLSSTLSPSKAPAISTVLRESTSSPVLFSTPQRKREGVYDRFFMARAGVKRNGRESQSEVSSPVLAETFAPTVPASAQKKGSRLFGSRQGRMTHQQSYSDDLTTSRSGAPGTGTEEFGLLPSMSFSHSTSFSKDASKSVNAVRKAFKAIVTGKSVARRQQSKVLL